MKRRTALQHFSQSCAGWVALTLGPAQLARGASVLAVRVWPAEDYTRLTLESDQPLKAQHFVTPDPHRLVIDLFDQDLTASLRDLVGKIKPDDPYIAGVRIGQNQPTVVRLVFDLRQAAKPEQFALPPAGNYKHRLVFDLYPQTERDPLHALLQDKLKSERDASRRIHDAMGSFIGELGQGRATAGGSATDSLAALSEGSSRTNRSRRGAGMEGEGSGGISTPRGNGRSRNDGPLAPLDDAAMRPTRAQRERMNRMVIVAIDPGHGGEDPGASGPTGLREKDVVLAIARQLKRRIDAKPGMRAMMTRDADFYVPLHDRVAKARKVQADLFISIHADAFTRPDVRGASVFALSTNGATSATANWLADKENSADVVGGVNASAKDRQVLRTMLEMSTAAQIRDSIKLGSEVLGNLGTFADLHKRRVEQAGFAVLKAPDIPSILVETAFISNPAEERRLVNPIYQRKLVDAIFAGIERYFAKKPPLSRRRMA